MLTGQIIEAARDHADIPMHIMCDAMDLFMESDYIRIVRANKGLSTYQQIMIFTVFEHHRASIPILCV